MTRAAVYLDIPRSSRNLLKKLSKQQHYAVHIVLTDSNGNSSQYPYPRKAIMDITEAEPSNVSSSPSIGAGGAAPPPLPPRVYLDPPPGYSLEDEGLQNLNVSVQWHSNDPRSSSTQSLVPIEADRNGRRTLLLIYIHGFMGNDTSFQSFPAHIHNLMSITLAETHAVHTKIYPRYKSRKAIEFARDDFSKW